MRACAFGEISSAQSSISLESAAKSAHNPTRRLPTLLQSDSSNAIGATEASHLLHEPLLLLGEDLRSSSGLVLSHWLPGCRIKLSELVLYSSLPHSRINFGEGQEVTVPRGRPTRETVYRRFAAAIAELQRFGGLPRPAEAAAIWDDIWHLEAHNSTAIEGNTLVLREVATLLDLGRAVGAKDIKDYLEVVGYATAARWVYAQAVEPGRWHSDELITVTEVRHVHHEAMSPVWEVAPHPDAGPPEGPGAFRRHDIHSFPGGMTPPAWTDVPAQLSTWTATAAEIGAQTRDGELAPEDVPVALARLHCEFERIHPFIDGNGRVGRLVLNLLLVRLGYPPAIVFKRHRDRYLAALDRADHGDPGTLAELIARSVIDNLHRFVVPNIAGPARLVPLRSLAGPDVSYDALRQAARRGRLDADLSSDGTWRSSRHAVAAYLVGRNRRSTSGENGSHPQIEG